MQVLLKMMSGIQTEQILWVTGELIVRDSAAPPKEEAHATARTA
jgi:hypothetical protein